jgi:hypothetical protein
VSRPGAKGAWVILGILGFLKVVRAV